MELQEAKKIAEERRREKQEDRLAKWALLSQSDSIQLIVFLLQAAYSWRDSAWSSWAQGQARGAEGSCLIASPAQPHSTSNQKGVHYLQTTGMHSVIVHVCCGLHSARLNWSVASELCVYHTTDSIIGWRCSSPWICCLSKTGRGAEICGGPDC